jgi:F420H(2)-dependent quinone reductase
MTLFTESGLDGQYLPSPAERVRTQVADYEASGGVKGGTLEGRPGVTLTSVGAKSGQDSQEPVMRIVDGDRYVAWHPTAGRPKPVLVHQFGCAPEGAASGRRQRPGVSNPRGHRGEEWYYWVVADQFWPYFPEYRPRSGCRDIPIMVLEPLAPYRRRAVFWTWLSCRSGRNKR